jgi:hypothetical protein
LLTFTLLLPRAGELEPGISLIRQLICCHITAHGVLAE